MLKVTVLLPVRDNQGERVPREIFREFESEVTQLAGGFTEDGIVKGEWVDEDGTIYRDRSRRYIIAANEEHLDGLREITTRTGSRIHQRTMYFEVSQTEIVFLVVQ